MSRVPLALLTAVAAGVTALVPAALHQLSAAPAATTLAYCYEVSVETPAWHPSVEVCNLPEIGGSGPL